MLQNSFVEHSVFSFSYLQKEHVHNGQQQEGIYNAIYENSVKPRRYDRSTLFSYIFWFRAAWTGVKKPLHKLQNPLPNTPTPEYEHCKNQSTVIECENKKILIDFQQIRFFLSLLYASMDSSLSLFCFLYKFWYLPFTLKLPTQVFKDPFHSLASYV